MSKQRRQSRPRNPVAKDLASDVFHQRVKGSKRRYLIDKLHEEEAEDDLHDFFGLGKATKE